MSSSRVKIHVKLVEQRNISKDSTFPKTTTIFLQKESMLGEGREIGMAVFVMRLQIVIFSGPKSDHLVTSKWFLNDRV